MKSCQKTFADHQKVVAEQRDMHHMATEYLNGVNFNYVGKANSGASDGAGGTVTSGAAGDAVERVDSGNKVQEGDTAIQRTTGGEHDGVTRDFEFEKDFAREYRHLSEEFQTLTQEVHYCEEWFKVIKGEYPNRYLTFSHPGERGRMQGTAAQHVVRMAESWEDEEKRMGQAGMGDVPLKEIPTTGKAEEGKDQDKGGVVERISVTKVEDISVSSTETAAAESVVPPSPATSVDSEQGERKDKKCITETKKPSEEKGKQESGVENS